LGQLPLHNHKNATRFANPVVPSTEDINQLRGTMSLFIRAVCFGLLERDEGEEAPYSIHLGGGDTLSVGSERDIRAEGLLASHRQELEASVQRFEQQLQPIQILAASALLEWTGKRAYAARKVQIDENRTDRVPGLLQMVALEVSKNYMNRFRAIPGSGGISDPESVRATLLELIPQWTAEIAGSVEDTDSSDTNRDPNDNDTQRAVDKRTVVKAMFTVEALDRLARPHGPAAQITVPSATPIQASVAPPPLPALAVHVAINGAPQGPFDSSGAAKLVASGQLGPATLVWMDGLPGWQQASQVPALASILAPPQPPPLPKAAPPPLPSDQS
jgi:hypothetical protein